MIYTKRKVGYYMGNTDIVATSLPDANAIDIRKGLGEIMGGKILKLRSEELLEQGEAKGKLEGKREERLEAIQNMLDLGLTKEQILKKYSLEEYEKA